MTVPQIAQWLVARAERGVDLAPASAFVERIIASFTTVDALWGSIARPTQVIGFLPLRSTA
jgi:hypothetical protein